MKTTNGPLRFSVSAVAVVAILSALTVPALAQWENLKVPPSTDGSVGEESH